MIVLEKHASGSFFRHTLDKSVNNQYNILAIGVWRSLVSRLVRVQEAVGSNPPTPTIENSTANGCFAVLFLYL